ncbi:mannose-P-dolichol utilization defect 1 protein-like isoform 2-T2 [Pholidichthys leucotaenia]
MYRWRLALFLSFVGVDVEVKSDAQVSQLFRILWRGSTDGLNLPSFMLQLYAFSCPVVYALANNFPFFAWAERLVTSAQSAVIVFVILHHRSQTLRGLLLLLSFGGGAFLLASYAAAAVISLIQASRLPALIASKVLQTLTNFQNGHTGELSTLSVILSWAGSISLVFVSIQDAGRSFTTLFHIISACLSSVLLVQVLTYQSVLASSNNKKRD